MKKIIFILSLLFVSISCSSDSDDAMSPNPTPSPDPIPLVTYVDNIKPIIDGACLNCHGNPTNNQAPMSLTTLAEVQQSVSSRGLISQVESGAMPQAAAPLSAVEIQAIKDWQAGGFK